MYFRLLFLLLLSVSGVAHGNQPATGSLPQLLRCYVTPLVGAYRPEGVAATMTVVNDGGMCVVNNWGPSGRTRADSGTITTSPAHVRNARRSSPAPASGELVQPLAVRAHPIIATTLRPIRLHLRRVELCVKEGM